MGCDDALLGILDKYKTVVNKQHIAGKLDKQVSDDRLWSRAAEKR